MMLRHNGISLGLVAQSAVFCIWLSDYVCAQPRQIINDAEDEMIFVIAAQRELLQPSQFVAGAYDRYLSFRSGVSPEVDAILLSPLVEVCSTLSVNNEYGRQFSFQTNHVVGKLDWTISIASGGDGGINNIAFVPSLSGPPTLLPVLPDGTLPDPSTQMGCVSEDDLRAAAREQDEVCQLLPEACAELGE